MPAAAAGITAVLTTMSLGLTMSPAAAAPDTNDIDSVQARVDKLSAKADKAEQRHDKAAAKLKKTRTQLRRTDRRAASQPAPDQHACVRRWPAPSSTSTAPRSAPPPPPRLRPSLDAQTQKDSTNLLANVVLVSEDAGVQGDALARVQRAARAR